MSWPPPPHECSSPQRQLLSSAPTCWFWVSWPAWEWQHWARTLGDGCQHSSCSLFARQEANRQAAGSSQAWRGLLRQSSKFSWTSLCHSTEQLQPQQWESSHWFFKKLPLQNLMSYYAVKGPASQYIVIHHPPWSPFVSGLLIWPEVISLIRMSSLTFSPFREFSIHRTFLDDSTQPFLQTNIVTSLFQWFHIQK